MKRKSKFGSGILLVFIGLFHIIPFYILLNLAFKADNDFSSKWQFPTKLFLDNFKNAWNEAHMSRVFVNNIIIVVISLMMIVIVGSFSSYPLSRNKSRINRIVYSCIIACTIVPALTILVPLYRIIVDIKAMSTYWGIILLHITFNMPLVVFLYTGFISMISKELDDAALIDGLSRFGIFFRIILPLLKPITITVIIVCGVGIWNDYQFSLFFLQKPAKYTLTIALSGFFSQFSQQVNNVAAGCVISVLPLVALFLFLQKYFIKGLASGAVKL